MPHICSASQRGSGEGPRTWDLEKHLCHFHTLKRVRREYCVYTIIVQMDSNDQTKLMVHPVGTSLRSHVKCNYVLALLLCVSLAL